MTRAAVDSKYIYGKADGHGVYQRYAQYCISKKRVPSQPGGNGTLDPYLGRDHVALIEDHLR